MTINAEELCECGAPRLDRRRECWKCSVARATANRPLGNERFLLALRRTGRRFDDVSNRLEGIGSQ
jgi:hypothetical protein